MLTFFRKIRKALLDSGSTGKYLLYAIGEIALVVIGILIALQINNWNEWRKDRIEEKEILREIIVEIHTNVQGMERDLRFNKRCSRSYEVMMNVIRVKPEWNDSLEIHVCTPLLATVPTISFAAYESLRAKGVDLIANKSLQKDIVALYEMNYRKLVTRVKRVLVENIKPLVPPFVTKRFVRSLGTWGAYFPNDFKKLVNDQEYMNLLTYVEGYRIGQSNGHLSRSLNESQRVLQLVVDELGENDE